MWGGHLTPRIEPLGAMVLVEPHTAPPPTGRIQLVSLEEQPAVRGKVLAIGPEVTDFIVGDMVLFSRHQGFAVQGYILINEGAVLATL